MKYTVILLLATTLSSVQVKQPISHFMRETGLLYVENVDDFTTACLKEATEDPDVLGCPSSEKLYTKIFNHIDAEIEIEKPEGGDFVFYKSLPLVRNAGGLHINSVLDVMAHDNPQTRAAMDEATYVFSYCMTSAKEEIKEGFVNTSTIAKCGEYQLKKSEGGK